MLRNSSNVAIICDADNTLWETDQIFREAHLWLLSRLTNIYCLPPLDANEQLVYVRQVDQAIASKHHAGLRYPVVLLVTALSRRLQGGSIENIVKEVIFNFPSITEAEHVEIAAEFDMRIRRQPSLRPGVFPTLQKLAQSRIPIIVATESSAERCSATLRATGLSQFVESVVSAPKTPELFLRLTNRLKTIPSHCLVVGDQLDRDIIPAMRSGLVGVYLPGGFSPAWAPSIDTARPSYAISEFSQLITLLENDFGQCI